jgi:serine/threonine-protein kinase
MQGGSIPKIGIRNGDVIEGRYRVDSVIGTGSTGVLLAATHLVLDRPVAIKLLLPEELADADALRRFVREARAAVKIKSEHVARILDVGTLDSGAPFIVMEHLQGEDLAARLARTGPLSVEEAVDFVMQACEAIAEAHRLGIVHRDLKPANLYCVRRSDGHASIKVLDFGISKVLAARGIHAVGEMTNMSVVVGSPFYMSPEQMQAPRSIDRRTDIWSIGVILYELLAGSVPFAGEHFVEICLKVTSRPAPPLRKCRPEVPEGLEAVVLQCLEKDPSKRFSSVAELATALAPFGSLRALVSLDGIAGSFKRLPDSEAAAEPLPTMHGAFWREPARRNDRRAALVALGFVLAALAAAFPLYYAALHGGGPALATATTSSAIPPASVTVRSTPRDAGASPPVIQPPQPSIDYIGFNPQQPMRLYEASLVTVAVGKIPDAVRQRATTPGLPAPELSAFDHQDDLIEVDLRGENFAIVAGAGSGLQAIDRPEPAVWKWFVTPQKPGNHTLVLSVCFSREVQGTRAKNCDPSRERAIEVVVVGLVPRLKYWNAEYVSLANAGKALVPVGLLAALVKWLWGWLRAKGGPPNGGSTPPLGKSNRPGRWRHQQGQTVHMKRVDQARSVGA